jgi:hypothetical protein
MATREAARRYATMTAKISQRPQAVWKIGISNYGWVHNSLKFARSNLPDGTYDIIPVPGTDYILPPLITDDGLDPNDERIV